MSHRARFEPDIRYTPDDLVVLLDYARDPMLECAWARLLRWVDLLVQDAAIIALYFGQPSTEASAVTWAYDHGYLVVHSFGSHGIYFGLTPLGLSLCPVMEALLG